MWHTYSADRSVHICGGNDTETPWRKLPATWRKKNPSARFLVHCCNRLAPAADVQGRYVTAYDGYVGNHEYRCHPKAGCNARPGYKRTAHLREGMYEVSE